MQTSDFPIKFTIPWANAAGGAFVRDIPTASQIGIIAGAASLTDGWPPLDALEIAAGGIPPDIKDQNGILKQITAGLRWQQASGPIYYDAAFAAAIGGYPQNSRLTSSVIADVVWQSTAENNTSNPDTGGANWVSLRSLPNTWTGVNTHANTILLNNGIGIIGKETGGTQRYMLFMDATNRTVIQPGGGGFRISNAAFSALNFDMDDAGNVNVRASVVVGGNIATAGGSVTGAYIHSTGSFNADGGVISGAGISSASAINSGASVNATTDISAGTAINAYGGDITAHAGRHRAAMGALLGDPASVPTLSDFASSAGANGYFRLPNGLVFQWVNVGVPRRATNSFAFPVTFPNAALGVVGSIGSVITPIALDCILGCSVASTSLLAATIESATGGPDVGCTFYAIGY